MIKCMLTKLKEDCELSKFLNHCLSPLNSTTILSHPRTFAILNEEKDDAISCYIYCQCLLFEDYASSLIKKLRQIVEDIEEYEGEFSSKWKYYAMAKRLEILREGYGETEDYDDNGEPITKDIPGDRLKTYSIVEKLYTDDWIDIVQDTCPRDLASIVRMIKANAEISITDFFRIGFGKTILPSVIDEKNGGKIRKMTIEEVDMKKALDEVQANDTSAYLVLLCGVVQYMFSKIKSLNKCADNEKELSEIKNMANSLLRFELDDIICQKQFMPFFKNLCKINEELGECEEEKAVC